MPSSPTKALEQLERTAAGWKTNAASASFYKLTQAEFEAKVELSRDVRRRLEEARRIVEALENERNDTDKDNLTIEGFVAKAVAGDPDYGEDSTLYESIGRTRKSERRRPGKKIVST